MSIIGNNIIAGASGNQGYEIERSLRFNRDDSTELNFTPSSTGNQRTWTWSAWIKRSLMNTSGTFQHLFNPQRGGDGSNESVMRFRDDNTLEIYDSGALRGQLITSQVFRDVSAWYHIVFVLDTTQATAANRAKLYVNGEQVTSFSTETYPSQDTTWGWNAAQEHGLGVYALYSAQYFSGYMAEVNFVDGTALNQYDFGKVDPSSGAWIPKKYSGTYGTNGFYLNFSDNSSVSALGTDSSGNGNNFTPSNFSVTAGAGNDSLEDTPTNNWCTLNPISSNASATLANGNLDTPMQDNKANNGTIGVSSGKWYWEVTVNDNSSYCPYLGVTSYSQENDPDSSPTLNSSAARSVLTISNPSTYKNYTASSTASGSNQGNHGTIGITLDLDACEIKWYKNNSLVHTDTTIPTDGTTLFPYFGITNSGVGGWNSTSFNFGQRAFSYPQTGFKALNTANLPVPTVKKGSEYFNTVLYVGNGTSQSITGVGFQPDWIITKTRSITSGTSVVDAVRGADKVLGTAGTSAEATQSSGQGITSFDSDGFSLGTDANLGSTNYNSANYVAWNWKAGGTTTTPTQGTIASTASVNTDAGFSIVSYTGSGSNGTIGHGLGVAPSMVIVKNRDRVTDWSVWAEPVVDQYGAAYAVFLQDTAGAGSYSGVFNSTAPTSTVFSVGTSSSTNFISEDYIAYCFAEVEGYSKVGSYTGNGSSDGVFIYLGFKPAFVIFKGSSIASNWCILDATRDTFNVTERTIQANSSAAELTTLSDCDFLSNGIKIRSVVTNDTNVSGQTYIYMAFAKHPFKYANAR